MNYDFATLSFTDFEALSRDLLGRELGVRFEAFPEGADDGMDGRHATAEGDVILQAKHYLRSGASKLKSKMGVVTLTRSGLQCWHDWLSRC